MSILKKSFPLILLLALIGCEKKENVENKKPNIIFILADDFGIMDSQAYASKFTNTPTREMYYETPNIDKLVNEGVAFSQAYANQLCSPTRASLITGKYASKIGVTTAMPPRKTYYNQKTTPPTDYYIHDVYEHKDNIKIEQALVNGISNSALATGTALDNGENEYSIAEALTGYHAAFIGKWHLGGFGAKNYQPSDHGFQTLAWYDGGGSPYFNWGKHWNKNTPERFTLLSSDEFDIGDSGKQTAEKYLTDDLTQQALNYISEQAKNKEKPFFLYFSHFAIHTPYQGKEEEVKYFSNKKTKGWNNHKDPVYASMIKSLDRSVGAILNKLEDLDLDENTLIVFMSDNGGIDSKITPDGKGSDNYPFLGGKACLTEGGIRVPLVFRWKGKIAPNKWLKTPVDCTDIYPTLADFGGEDSKKLITQLNLDGQSLKGLINDIDNSEKSYTKDTHFWHYPFNVIYNNPLEKLPLTPHSAIRKGDYKLIFDWYGRFHLYNIEKDPFEKENLVAKNTELTQELFEELMQWLKKNVAKRYWPKLNTSYDKSKESRNSPFKDYFTQYD